MAQNRSHVPKFGNWDREDEYTAYFETARREKDLNSMTMVNPNDPEENPEPFNSLGRNSRRRSHSNQRSSRESNNGSFIAESVSSTSNHSDQIMLQRRDNRRSVSSSRGVSVGRAGSFSSSSNNRRGSGSHSSRESQNQKVAAVPKFGEWDEKDPKSGESFTVIFSKLKQEKVTETDEIPPHATSKLANFSNVPNQRQRPSAKTRGPKYCCFFN